MNAPIQLPAGEVIVKAAFICNATISGIPMSRFAKPNVRGLKALDKAPSFSFFIQHPSGRRILFDVGVSKDWKNLSPVLVQRMRDAGWTAEVEKDVPEILQENGIQLQSIETVIWSHWHWDHIGDMSRFPASASILTGPGVVNELPRLPLLRSDYTGGKLSEVPEFELEIGGLRAHDYFGDGAFYLLSTPGHAVGHLSALARTTSHSSEDGDTFILMGGDCCHHVGQIRPSTRYPLPCELSFDITPGLSPPDDKQVAWERICNAKGTDIPFLSVSDYSNGASAAENPRDADISSQKLRGFDQGCVLFAISHDKTLLNVVEQFPAFANDWKRKGWAERARWLFLRDFDAMSNV